MDIGSAFTFVFDDDDWIKKLAIGGAIALGAVILMPLLGLGILLLFPIAGYMLEVLKNVRDGQARPLPEWDDLGGLFKTGFFVSLIMVVYNLPALVFACAGGLASSAPEFVDPEVASSLIFLGTCFNCIQFILSVAASLIFPAGLIRYAQYETFGSAFQFGAIFSFIGNNIGDYIIALVLSWVASFIAFFGILLCLVGVLFTTFWALLVSANLYGQLARESQTEA